MGVWIHCVWIRNGFGMDSALLWHFGVQYVTFICLTLFCFSTGTPAEGPVVEQLQEVPSGLVV
jgi:hypothetical protein